MGNDDRWIGDLAAANASHAATLKELEALHSRLRDIVRAMRLLADTAEYEPIQTGAQAAKQHVLRFANMIEAELPPHEEKLSSQVASLQAQLDAAQRRTSAAEGGRESLLQVIRIMDQR